MNKALLRLSGPLLLLLAAAVPGWALEDTPANRAAQADHYLQAVPAQQMGEQITQAIFKQTGRMGLTEEKKAQLEKAFNDSIDWNAMAASQKEGLVKTFTADEIQAMADFYSSPVGQSVLRKMPAFTGEIMAKMQSDIMPKLQAALMKVMTSGASPAP